MGDEDPDADVEFALVEKQGPLDVLLNDEGVVLQIVRGLERWVLTEKLVQNVHLLVANWVSVSSRSSWHLQRRGIFGDSNLSPAAVIPYQFLDFLETTDHMYALPPVKACQLHYPQVFALKMAHWHGIVTCESPCFHLLLNFAWFQA